MERHSFRRVLGNSLETMQNLCLSTKFPHQEIRRNFGIFRLVMSANSAMARHQIFNKMTEVVVPQRGEMLFSVVGGFLVD